MRRREPTVETKPMRISIHGRTLELAQGDITDEKVDAIVNAANSRLAGGGGVDGAVHRRGGRTIMEELARRYPDGCPTGSAVVTAAGNLEAQFVIHAVGPIWQGGQSGEPELLAGAYRTALELASAHGCKSVALPAISCGVYGYPVDLASQTALSTTRQFLVQDATVASARFVLFGEGMYGAFARVLETFA